MINCDESWLSTSNSHRWKDDKTNRWVFLHMWYIIMRKKIWWCTLLIFYLPLKLIFYSIWKSELGRKSVHVSHPLLVFDVHSSFYLSVQPSPWNSLSKTTWFRNIASHRMTSFAIPDQLAQVQIWLATKYHGVTFTDWTIPDLLKSHSEREEGIQEVWGDEMQRQP